MVTFYDHDNECWCLVEALIELARYPSRDEEDAAGYKAVS